MTGAAALPQESVYEATQVCAQLHPLLFTGPAVPTFGENAPWQLSTPVKTGGTTVGLQPRFWLVAVVEITGATVSTLQV